MQIEHVTQEVQIGGGSGWVAARVSEGLASTRAGLAAATGDWKRPPLTGTHPREAALAASREAVTRLHEALSVEAPEDAIEDTRHALEELSAAIAELELTTGQAPVARFEKAVELLTRAEWRLTNASWGFG